MSVDGITRTDAEALFAEAVAPRVVEQATKRSVFLSSLPVLPMGDKTERIPVLAALPSAGFLAADQDVKALSEVSWDKKILTAEEVACIVPISETVIADASIDVVAKVTDLLAQAFGVVVDAAVGFGTGAPASWPTDGLFGVADTAGQIVDRTSDTSTDFNDLFAALEEIGYDVTDLFAAKAMKAVLRGQKNAQGNPVFLPTDGSATINSIYGVNLGYPLGWDAATASVLAVDRSTVMMGVRQDVTIKILDQATLTGWGNLAEKDSIAVRAVMRVAFQVANPVTLDAGARAYGVAALVPATEES